MKVPVYSNSGTASTPVEVSDALFAVRFNQPLVHQAVVAYQANGRQGTRAQKTRAEVRGGGRKPWKQKGTGQARSGTIRSPLWRGGGKVFPSTMDENFSQKLNRKMHRAAMRSIFSELVRQDRLVAVDDFALAVPKTKQLLASLTRMNALNVLLVTDGNDRNLALSARNLPHVEVNSVSEVNPVSLIRHDKVIISTQALKKLEALFA